MPRPAIEQARAPLALQRESDLISRHPVRCSEVNDGNFMGHGDERIHASACDRRAEGVGP